MTLLGGLTGRRSFQCYVVSLILERSMCIVLSPKDLAIAPTSATLMNVAEDPTNLSGTVTLTVSTSAEPSQEYIVLATFSRRNMIRGESDVLSEKARAVYSFDVTKKGSSYTASVAIKRFQNMILIAHGVVRGRLSLNHAKVKITVPPVG